MDGLVRWYRNYIPDPLPENHDLMLYLHGGTLNMRSIARKFAGLDNLIIRRLIGPVCHEVEGVRLAWNFFRETEMLSP